MNYIYELHKIMLSKKLILVYEGEFTQENTKIVLSMAENNMEKIGEENNIKRKVFNVMVECLQNICKHADEYKKVSDDIEDHPAIFMIGKGDEGYVVASGNAMHTEKVESLKEKLHHINSLDKEGLKNLYKDIITKGTMNEKGGAGLGLIDMARKSGQKLDFDFEKIDNKFSFFSIQTKISSIPQTAQN